MGVDRRDRGLWAVHGLDGLGGTGRDAGAARGYRQRTRVSGTTEVIWEIQQHTNLVAWLNPVPKMRWNNTTASIISHLIPMFPMDQEGLRQAILTLQR